MAHPRELRTAVATSDFVLDDGEEPTEAGAGAESGATEPSPLSAALRTSDFVVDDDEEPTEEQKPPSSDTGVRVIDRDDPPEEQHLRKSEMEMNLGQ